jgi:hypothetical protein
MRRPFNSQRWPLVLANGVEDRTASHVRVTLVAVGILLLGAAPTVPGIPMALRVLIGAAAVLVLAFAATRRRKTMPATGTCLAADASGLSRISFDGTKPIVKWDAPFGVTLLASYGRPHALLAFTTPTQTRYVPARIDGRSEAED